MPQGQISIRKGSIRPCLSRSTDSAPDIAGTGQANPLAAVWSVSQMMDFFGYEEWGKRILDAIEQLLTEKKSLPRDLGGSSTTEAVGNEIVRLLERA